MPSFLLPSPVTVVRALIGDWQLLAGHAVTSLAEAALGLAAGIALGFAAAILMDRFELVYRAFYPLVVLTQTIPTVAIAPLLVLWFGYGMLPKVVLIVIATFFPITVGLLDGFRSVDPRRNRPHAVHGGESRADHAPRQAAGVARTPVLGP